MRTGKIRIFDRAELTIDALLVKGVGRRCAGAWLDANIAEVGERSTVNLGEVFI